MATITTIQGSDILATSSRQVINSNFDALNAAKVEGAAALTTAGAIPWVSAAGVVTSDPTKLRIDPTTGAVTVPAGLIGNAATATRLATPRTIAGVAFDGTANIAIASTGLSDSDNLVRQTFKQTSGVNANAGRLIILCGDSLTDGAGGSTFRTTLEAQARAQYGFGGSGYWGFSFYGATPGFTKSAGVQYIAIDDGIYGQYSPDGRGVYVASGGGSDTFSFTMGTYYDNARIYYLVQSGGGSFTLNTPGGDTVISTSGTLGIGSVDVSYGTGAVTASAITGNVAIFGAMFTINNRAPVFGNFAIGGRTLQQVASQNSAFRRAWMTALAPSLYVLNAGMNDRTTRSAAQHNADLTAIVSDIQTGSATTGVLIVQSHEPSDAATSNFNSYAAEKIAVAQARNVGYLDLRPLFGTYTQANAGGLMTDAVHASATGNNITANALARFIGAQSAAQDPGATTAIPAVRTGTLATQAFTVPATTARTVYSLGLTTGFPVGAFTVKITANRNGTSAINQKEHSFAISGTSSSNGQAAAVSAITTRTIMTVNAGDAQTIDWTPSISVVSGKAVLVITTNSFIGHFVVEGSWAVPITGSTARQQVYSY